VDIAVVSATHRNLRDMIAAQQFREDLYYRLNGLVVRLPALRERNEDVPALARFFLQKSAKELGVEPKRITDDALESMKGFDFPGNVRQLENICHWLTVMAPAQMIEPKDLPPELAADPAVVAVATTPVVVAPVAAPPAAVAAGPTDLAAAPAAPADATGSVAAHGGESSSTAPVSAPAAGWLAGLEHDARARLQAGEPEVWDALTRQFEAQLIRTALEITRGRRIEAAQKLGIGRNTITRKIQELGLDD